MDSIHTTQASYDASKAHEAAEPEPWAQAILERLLKDARRQPWKRMFGNSGVNTESWDGEDLAVYNNEKSGETCDSGN
ncbi:hypothetical protein AB5N19_12679 [Seiridium cardinale]|uniref:Uncharacterized protein n=1 Tax=Seiridium cardinale TaxID=138064 RepID=A0ABR2X885_9PEZI